MAAMEMVPAVRFPGFVEPWADKALGEIGTIIGGGTPSTSIAEYWGGEIDWYAPAEIGEAVFADASERKITSAGLASSSAVMLPAHRTVLFTSRAGIGDMAILRAPGCTNQGFQSVVVADSNSPYFVYSMGSQIKDKAIRIASGSTFLEISGKQLAQLRFYVPEGSEQAQIGALFEHLDALIELQCKELTKLRQFKQAMLGKMFPQPGASVPEVRFSGFTAPWVCKELGEIGDPFSGLAGKTKEDFGHGGAEYITYVNVLRNAISSSDGTDRVEVDNSQFQVRRGDVLFTTSSEIPEEVGMSSVWLSDRTDVYLNSFCFGLRPKISVDSNFLGRILRSPSVRRQFVLLAQGISRFNISKTKSMRIKLQLPAILEQEFIGKFFSELDELISLQERKGEKLMQVKQSMLDRMFV